jgi:Leucine-rich repeat (LRR) protein
MQCFWFSGVPFDYPVSYFFISFFRVSLNSIQVGMNLMGTLPTENGLLTSLELLTMENNMMVGAIPTELCHLTNLKRLNLGQNQFRFTIPSCIGQLSKLEYLYVHENDLTDRLPESMKQLHLLQHLIINGNALTGDPTAIWNNLTGVQVLLANQNEFSAPMDDTFLLHHKNLTWLNLADNDFVLLKSNQTLPKHLLQMSHLEVFDLSGNRLQGNLPADLQPNIVLKYLSLYDNAMYGGLHELTNLKKIQHLDVSANAFTGIIRSEFGLLTNLRLLFMGENEFEPGEIPRSFANLTLLEDLSLRKSKIYGPLNVSHLPRSLIYLDLGSNDLSGNVPAEIGDFKHLEYLILNDNKNITGALPTTITQLQKLRTTFLDGTSLSSNVEEICNLPKIKISKKAAYADCGRTGDDNVEVDCSCCTCCNDIESNGTGCSINYQLNLRKEWSVDFQTLKFSVTNGTVSFNRTHVHESSN